MKRVVALIVVVLLAAAAAWWIRGSADTTGDAACTAVERRLKAADIEGAKRLVAESKGKVPAHVGRYLDALMALTARDEAAALKAVEDAYAAGPAAHDNWRVVSLVFYMRVRTGRVKGAWDAVDKYLAAHPTDERALVVAAQYWVEVSRDAPDPSRAKDYLARYAALASHVVPDDDPTAVTPDLLERIRGEVAKYEEHWGSAITAGEARVKADPNDAAAYAQLGEAYRMSGRNGDARTAYRAAVSLDLGSALYRKQLVLILLEADDTGDEVLELTDALAKLDPKDPWIRYFRARGLVRVKRGKDDATMAEAIDIYRELAKEPSTPPALRRDVFRNLGVALYDWKQGGTDGVYLDEAHQCLVEYVKLGGEIDSRLGDIWVKLEDRAREKGAGPK